MSPTSESTAILRLSRHNNHSAGNYSVDDFETVDANGPGKVITQHGGSRRRNQSTTRRSVVWPIALGLLNVVVFLNIRQLATKETSLLTTTSSIPAAAGLKAFNLAPQHDTSSVTASTSTASTVADSLFAPSPTTAAHNQGRTTTAKAATLEAIIAGIHPTSPYAYMFVIGGIDPDTPGYRGFLYNVLVAVDILKKQGSTADMWLFLQLHPNSNHTHLPQDETAALQALKIHTLYLDKPQSSSFGDLVMEKFRTLQLIQYRRVMFLDADVLPFTNMDYLFELSDHESARSKALIADDSNSASPLLKPNFIIATKGEPCNAGVFMVEPKPADYEKLHQIVDRQREQAKDLPYPHFSKEFGWGHSFLKEGDEWQSVEKTGKRWTWHAVHSDQGLLYQWVRYHEASYTAFRGHTVDNFVRDTAVDTTTSHGMPRLEALFGSSLVEAHEPPTKIVVHHPCGKDDYNCRSAPYSNYRHFVGKSKPWQYGYRGQQDIMRMDRYHVRAYFEGLFDLSQRLGLGFTRDNVNERLQGESPLGKMAGLQDFTKLQQQADKTS